MAGSTPRLLLTPGEPAGIGPDLAVQIAQQAHDAQIIAIADPQLLRERADQLGLALKLQLADYTRPARPQVAGELTIDPATIQNPVVTGQLDAANSNYVLATLDRAVDLCLSNAADGLVTGPVNKAVINQAGVPFTGHTDYLAARCQCSPPVMMLATDRGDLRVALATVHIPLAAVPGQITHDLLTHTLDVIYHDLRARFGISAPRILVAGLNPHAGESGYLGREEIDVIEPALAAARSRGIQVTGPLPADTVFNAERLQHGDVVLAMYHDQGLPVIKHAGFSRTVNVSLGLPIIRTSVDHGSALELAGTGQANPGSLEAALATATRMIRHNRGT